MKKLTGFWLSLGMLMAEALSLAHAEPQWYLMFRHGECSGIEVLKRKIEDLGAIHDPYAFIKFLREKGDQVTVKETSLPNGKVVEVTVLGRELALIFVTEEVCQTTQRKAP